MFNDVFLASELLVGNGDLEESQGYRSALSEFHYFKVQAGIDGQVVFGAHAGSTPNGQAIPVDVSPLDHIDGVKLTVHLATRIAVRIGARSALTVARDVSIRRAVASELQHLKLGRGYDPRMGIPPEHLQSMIDACKETGVIAIFRANKAAAIPLIREGAHGKQMWAKFKTSNETGVLTAKDAKDRLVAYQNGAFVVEADTIAGRTARRITTVGGRDTSEVIHLQGNWKLEPGQVVARDGKPFVGDYDLLGVAPMKSPGSNVSLVPDDVVSGDWTGPWVEKFSSAVNKRLDKDRVLHGAQDAYGGTPEYRGLTNDVAYAVFPDGTTHIMTGKAGTADKSHALTVAWDHCPERMDFPRSF